MRRWWWAGREVSDAGWRKKRRLCSPMCDTNMKYFLCTRDNNGRMLLLQEGTKQVRRERDITTYPIVLSRLRGDAPSVRASSVSASARAKSPFSAAVIACSSTSRDDLFFDPPDDDDECELGGGGLCVPFERTPPPTPPDERVESDCDDDAPPGSPPSPLPTASSTARPTGRRHVGSICSS
jgi:hypothetical protein